MHYDDTDLTAEEFAEGFAAGIKGTVRTSPLGPVRRFESCNVRLGPVAESRYVPSSWSLVTSIAGKEAAHDA